MMIPSSLTSSQVTVDVNRLTQSVIDRAKSSASGVRSLVFESRPVHAGEVLFARSAPALYLLVVKAGFFKTSRIESDGVEHVLGFPMRGDLMGADALLDGRHQVQAQALTDGEVLVVPAPAGGDPNRGIALSPAEIRRAMAADLLRLQDCIAVRGLPGADAKVAGFLLQMGRWMAARGFSPSRFNLAMKRADIASYLGLTIETVSRAFTSLAHQGLIEVDRKSVALVDRQALARLAGQ